MAKDYREEFWKGLKELEEKIKELMERQEKTNRQIKALTKAISELNGV